MMIDKFFVPAQNCCPINEYFYKPKTSVKMRKQKFIKRVEWKEGVESMKQKINMKAGA